MTRRAGWAALLGALAACGAPTDDDFDGVVADEDCDDQDPLVYPGAVDLPGDGLDADCDGEDPEPAWIGDWTLEAFSASTFGVELFLPGTESGSLSVSPGAGDGDPTGTISLSATLDPLIIGFELEITLEMDGTVSPVPDPGAMAFYAEGVLYEELVHVDWACSADEPEALACAGEVKALDSSLAGIARYVRR